MQYFSGSPYRGMLEIGTVYLRMLPFPSKISLSNFKIKKYNNKKKKGFKIITTVAPLPLHMHRHAKHSPLILHFITNHSPCINAIYGDGNVTLKVLLMLSKFVLYFILSTTLVYILKDLCIRGIYI